MSHEEVLRSGSDGHVKAALALIDATDALPGLDLPDDGVLGEDGAAVRRFGFRVWGDFFQQVQQRRARATCIIDFAYSDGGRLKDDDRSVFARWRR